MLAHLPARGQADSGRRRICGRCHILNRTRPEAAAAAEPFRSLCGNRVPPGGRTAPAAWRLFRRHSNQAEQCSFTFPLTYTCSSSTLFFREREALSCERVPAPSTLHPAPARHAAARLQKRPFILCRAVPVPVQVERCCRRRPSSVLAKNVAVGPPLSWLS